MATMTIDVEEAKVMRVPAVRWLSPADALRRIETITDCDRGTALVRLRTALMQGRLGVRWCDEGGDESDSPPAGDFWNEASIRLDHGGEVLHQVCTPVKAGNPQAIVEREDVLRYRGFAVKRDDLHALWPIAESDQSADETQASFSRPRADVIRDCARRVYVERADDPPNMDEAERLIRAALPRANRDTVRNVLWESEFAIQRRRSGVRRLRKPCR